MSDCFHRLRPALRHPEAQPARTAVPAPLRRWLMAITVLLVGGDRNGQTVQAAPSKLPHIVVILADDMGYGDVCALNDPSRISTPHLDRLAAESLTFTDGHSPSAVCTPTRYGVLTGRYCWRTRLKRGVLGGYSRPLLDRKRATIGSLLKRRGYQTAAIGKWHLGMQMPLLAGKERQEQRWDGDGGVDFGGRITDSPVHHGFDRFFGVSASLDMAPYVYIRNDRFTMRPSLQQHAVKFPHFVRQGPRAEDFMIDQVLDRLADEAVDFIRTGAEGSAPLFLYLALTAPHKPAQPHARFRGKTGLGEYGDFVAQVDDTVGRVLTAIDAADIRDQTLVFYSSDNGSYMYRFDAPHRKDHIDDATVQGYRSVRHRANGPFRGTKADIYEAGHHVPLLARWPGRTKPGTDCGTTVCLTDLFATCAEVAGATLDENMAEDSFSLVGMLRGEDVERGAPVIHHSIAGMFAIRVGRWKLIAGNGSGGRQQPRGKPFAAPYQLYDLEADRGESRNVAAQHPAVVERMTEQLTAIRERGRSRPLP